MANILVLIFLSLATSMTYAQDYGNHGHVFPIIEESLIEYLEQRIQSLTQQQKEDISQKVQDHYKKTILNPHPVKNLKRALTYAVHYFDPKIVAKQDIQDAQGRIIVEKGASYSPLEHVSLSEELLFFDGDDAAHIEWAKSLEGSTKWILVAGHPLGLEKQEKRAVYFDQNGLLTRKLSITAIPARVSQDRLLLKIEIIPLEGKGC